VEEAAMAWTWRYEDEAGAVVSPEGAPAPDFPSQADAETWIGEMWRDLLGAGVHQVTLLEDDREVYGPMGLSPAP
jgi:hypothetical protein